MAIHNFSFLFLFRRNIWFSCKYRIIFVERVELKLHNKKKTEKLNNELIKLKEKKKSNICQRH